MDGIREIAKKLVGDGKGIMATDAGVKSLAKRGNALGIKLENEEERRQFRNVLYTAKGLGGFVGGVIMNEEAVKQSANDGRTFIQALNDDGVLAGVKVDKGPVDMPNFLDEKVTEGLDGLRERLAEYYKLGARFTKWRGVIVIDERRPNRAVIEANAQALARYAALSQEAGMVPIVEPEVVMEGAHSLDRCAEVTENVSRIVFETLLDQKVDPAGMLYKSNMVIQGIQNSEAVVDEEVAKRTVEVLKKTVSVGVPGVVFLSGGQEAIAATRRLNEIVRVGAGTPWRWTFSFERAFEDPVMKVWLGKEENLAAAQAELLKRAEMNSLASGGKYQGE